VPDLVITDVKMPGMSGIDVLRQLRQRKVDLPVIVISAYADVAPAVEAMKLGAEDFLGKPFSRDHLLVVVEKALSRRRMAKELDALRRAATGVERPIIHRSAAMTTLLAMTDRFAASDATALICGPSGSGKELIARRLHAQSPRALQPFVPVNLAAIPATLLESELFGHVKGAFTGAVADRIGRFRQASGGTLFLDEIAELPLAAQSRLLRVLQEKVVDPLGSDAQESVDVRVIAATNRNLPDEIREGRFREDLYYRLNVVQLNVPRLADRPEDILPLSQHFTSLFAKGRSLAISDELHAALLRHPWNGNVRELENVCRRLVLLAEGDVLRPGDLPFGDSEDTGAEGRSMLPVTLPDDGFSLMDLEKQVIVRVLAQKSWNVSKTAEHLKIPRHVLAYRMEKYGIRKPD